MIQIPYVVHYYETDKMGIVHHSNYIRWFEDARLAWLDAADVNFAFVESKGLLSPVVSVACEYKRPAGFGDTLTVEARCSYYNGVRLEFAYRVEHSNKTVIAEGRSKHCFQRAGSKRPVSVEKEWPDFHVRLNQAFEEESVG